MCPCSKAAHHWQECSQENEGRWPREVTFLLCSELVRPHQQYCVWFGAPQCKKDRDTSEQAQQRPLRWLAAVVHDIRGGAERAGYVQDGEEKAKEDLTAVCSYLMSQTYGDLLASQGQPTTEVHSERTRSNRNRQKLQEGKFQLYIKKNFSAMVMVKYWCPRGCPEKNWNIPPWRHSELN